MTKYILISMTRQGGTYTGKVQSSKGGPLLVYRGAGDEWNKQGSGEIPNKKIKKVLLAGQDTFEGTGLPTPPDNLKEAVDNASVFTDKEMENAKAAIEPEKKTVNDILEAKRLEKEVLFKPIVEEKKVEPKKNIPVVDTGKGLRTDTEEIAKQQQSFAERMAAMRARTEGKQE